MAYHQLANDSGGTADDRRNEADRIVGMFVNQYSPERMTEKEAQFVAKMLDRKQTVSTKQLFWLRDIKDKYL